MYSIDSIQKMVKLMKAAEEKYESTDLASIQMAISEGNRKIGNVLNVSLPPVKTCASCKQCMFYCYDIKACLQYPNTVIDARIRNYIILMRDRNEYFNRIQERLNHRKTNKFFRFHVAGDIIDIDYFDRMVQLAKANPDFIFWTYTKNYPAVNAWVKNHGNNKAAIPSNLSIMFSEWRGLEMVNPYGFGEFRVVFKDEEKPTGFYCPGNCDVCTKNKCGCIVNETTYCNEH